MQNGLAGAPELLCGLIERQITLRDVGNEPCPDLVSDSDPPGSVRGGLLGGEQPGAEPSVDRRLRDTELARGLLDGEQAAVGVGWWRSRDPVLDAKGRDAWLVERQAGSGASALLVEDRRDLLIAGVGGELADERGGLNADDGLRVYRMRLTGKAEIPKGAPTGSGYAIIAIHRGSVVCWRFAHLHGFFNATVAQIHVGFTGRSGRVVQSLSTGPSLHHQGCIQASAAEVTAIKHDPSAYYVNVHSRLYPTGAVRGQL